MAVPSPNPEPAPVIRMVLAMGLASREFVVGGHRPRDERRRTGGDDLAVLRNAAARHADGADDFSIAGREQQPAGESDEVAVGELHPFGGSAGFDELPQILAVHL